VAFAILVVVGGISVVSATAPGKRDETVPVERAPARAGNATDSARNDGGQI
jgi:hypothetical protein